MGVICDKLRVNSPALFEASHQIYHFSLLSTLLRDYTENQWRFCEQNVLTLLTTFKQCVGAS